MLVVTVVLLLATGIIWFQALKPVAAESTGCNTPGPAPSTQTQTSRTKTPTTTFGGAPSTTSKKATTSSSATRKGPTTLGTLTDKNTLASVRPAPPAGITLNVFNASQQRGMAKTMSDELRNVGFASIGAVDNDPLYPAGDLRCVGEIRYGAAGVAGARTALIMMPCAQLVVDSRVDDSVDMAIGARFEFADTPETVKTELKAISEAATPPAVIDGRTLAPRSTMPIPPLPTAACAS